jgi:hypothetical protein
VLRAARLIFWQTTWHYIRENTFLHSHHRETTNSQDVSYAWRVLCYGIQRYVARWNTTLYPRKIRDVELSIATAARTSDPTCAVHASLILEMVDTGLKCRQCFGCRNWHTLYLFAERSNVWTVFARWNTWIVGSNPTRGVDVCVCVYSVFVLSCVWVAALWRADPPSMESCRLCIGLRNWKSGQGPTYGCAAIERDCMYLFFELCHAECYICKLGVKCRAQQKGFSALVTVTKCETFMIMGFHGSFQVCAL